MGPLQRAVPCVWMWALGLATASSCLAGPMDRSGAAVGQTSGTPETNQANSAFRAGVQAQVKGDMDAAKLQFEAALKVNPRHVPSLIGLAGVAQSRGALDQAAARLQQAQDLAPSAPEVHLAQGRLALSRRDPAAAELAFRKAHGLAPKQIPPLLELGDLYLRTDGRGAEAVRAYSDAVALNNNNGFAQYGLGVAAAATGQRDLALRALERAATLVPTDPAPLRAIGRLQLEANALAPALAAFDRGLARQPKFLPLMLDRADVLARQARWKEAADQLTAADLAAPRSAEITVKRGDVEQGAERWDPAEAFYLSALAIDPKNAVAFNNLAWMTVQRKGDSSKAVAWARQAVALSPRSSPFHDTLGWAERAAGDLNAARASLQRAIDIEPNVASYHLHLGTVLAEAKQTPQAKAALQRAVALNPPAAQLALAQRLLRDLPQ